MGGIESSMFTILDLLLLHESWILKLVLISTDDRTLQIHQGNHF